MILIVSAMESEAKELIKLLTKKPLFDDHFYYHGKVNNKELCLVITGVGKVNASTFLSALLMKEIITEIINIGYAGAIGNYQVGDIVLIEQVKYGDVDVTPFTDYKLGQIPKMPLYFKSNHKLMEKVKENISKTSNLFTQDKFVLDGTEEGLYDMEGASFYQTALIFNKPIVAIKVVSDLIGKSNQITNYNEFENKSSYLIKEIVEKIL